ncbi:hypothetical protein TNCV_2132911 [Trichonephila clavipes]|nr:hypothetical protein TNCV_2132911 [Trichonephila clavipes]
MGSELAKNGRQHDQQNAKMVMKLVAKSPTWSPKIMPTWLYRQDFAKFPVIPLYNMESCNFKTRTLYKTMKADANDWLMINWRAWGVAFKDALVGTL